MDDPISVTGSEPSLLVEKWTYKPQAPIGFWEECTLEIQNKVIFSIVKMVNCTLDR